MNDINTMRACKHTRSHTWTRKPEKPNRNLWILFQKQNSNWNYWNYNCRKWFLIHNYATSTGRTSSSLSRTNDLVSFQTAHSFDRVSFRFIFISTTYDSRCRWLNRKTTTARSESRVVEIRTDFNRTKIFQESETKKSPRKTTKRKKSTKIKCKEIDWRISMTRSTFISATCAPFYLFFE